MEKTSKKGEKGKPEVGEGDVFGKGGGQWGEGKETGIFCPGTWSVNSSVFRTLATE